MAITRFLTNRELWKELKLRVARAKRVWAASAYFGTDGAELLPLKKGDRLVVDMSMGAVRQGVTNPREIQRLMESEVQVFTRASLHAKFFLIDDILIVGSSNVSQSSFAALDEAALLTTSKQAIGSARKYFCQLCSEPVRDKYLQECLKAYKPPRFKAARMSRSKPKRKGAYAKLWFLANLRFIEPPRGEVEKIEALEEQAREDGKSNQGDLVLDSLSSRAEVFC